MKKSIFQRLIVGFKKGYNTPTLPENLLNFQNNVFVRYLRITGGLSAVLLITGRLDKLNLGKFYSFIVYLCFFLTLVYFIYSIYISYYRIKHMYKVFKSDELDVRNSPLDRLATA